MAGNIGADVVGKIEQGNAEKWVVGDGGELKQDGEGERTGREGREDRSVFEIIGKSHYQGQKRTQRLRCAIL